MPRPQLLFASNAIPKPSAEPLRVVVAGENPLKRAALMMRLSAFGDLAVFEAERADEASRMRGDVILADSIDVERSSTPVVQLVPDGAAATTAVSRGAQAVLLQSASLRRIHTTLWAVAEGLFVVEDDIADQVVPNVRGSVELIEPLTPRELEVAQLLARGLSNKEIAQRLAITGHTVKFHLNGILRKLGVSSRTEAVVRAARLGLVTL
jgi:two-component system, NarL family, nitrate/nitrite response regulator NarL